MRKMLAALFVLLAVQLVPVRGEDARPIRIWPLGDSITGSYTQYPGYRPLLWKMLKPLNRPVDFVGSITRFNEGAPTNPDFDADHDGHWGYRTDQVLGYLALWAADAKPDIVLLHIGSNDAFQQRPVKAVLENIREIIAKLRETNPSVTVVVAQIIPTAMPVPEIQDLNEGIAKLSSLSTATSKVVIVDQWTGIDPAADLWDGVHPNAVGAAKMAATWFGALKKLPEFKSP